MTVFTITIGYLPAETSFNYHKLSVMAYYLMFLKMIMEI